MSDDAASCLQRFEAPYAEHSWAARVSRRMSDDSFTSLLSAGSDLLLLDDSDEVVRKITNAMADCISTLTISATGAHGEEFAVPEAAGYLLDAIYAYVLLQRKALHRLNGSIDDESRSTFRDLIRSRALRS